MSLAVCSSSHDEYAIGAKQIKTHLPTQDLLEGLLYDIPIPVLKAKWKKGLCQVS